MEISLKVQNIGATYNPEAKNIVITHEFDVPSEQLLLKRGRLFITLKISASGDFDLKDTASLFLDSVQENFYRLTEETPLHSLEKALNRATKLVLTMKSRDESISLGSVEANFKLNFATALVWNRVLYTSYFGSPAVYLVRGTGVRNLSLNPAVNELWTNSGMLDDQDVVIIGTDKFAKTFPPTEIINSLGNISQTIATHPDKDELAALLIKVTTSEKETKSGNPKFADSKMKDAIYNSFAKLKSKFADTEKLSDRFKFYQNKKTAPVSSISALTPPAANTASVNMPKGPKRISSSKGSKKTKKRTAVGLAMVMMFSLVGYQIFAKPQGAISNDINARISIVDSKGQQVKGASTESLELSEDNDLHPAFIDLNSLGGAPTITGLSTTIDKVMVLDAASKRLYSINPETKESKNVFDGFEESALPQFLECEITLCYVGDSNKFYVLNPEKPEKVDDYLPAVDGIIDIFPFANALYFLTNNQIYRYPIGGKNPEATKWLAEGQTLNNAKSMYIDNGLIYVMTDTEIIRFSNKTQDPNFKIDYSEISNPISMEIANGKIYVLNVTDGEKDLKVYAKGNGDYIENIELSQDSESPKLVTFPKYSKEKAIFEKNKVLYEITL